MGQYYKPIVLESSKKNYPNKEKVVASIEPWDLNMGAKLMEHSYINNNLVSAFEELINAEHGKYAHLPIVWAGDYADPEPLTLKKEEVTLYDLAEDYGVRVKDSGSHYRYIINEDTNEFIDTNKVVANEYGLRIHPLPLLCCEGNGRGGGDYRGNNMDKIGIWARNVIVVSNTLPTECKEIEIAFKENY